MADEPTMDEPPRPEPLRPLDYGRPAADEPMGCGGIASALAGLVVGFIGVAIAGPFTVAAVFNGKVSDGIVLTTAGVATAAFVVAAVAYARSSRRAAAASVVSRRFLIGLLLGGGVACLVAGACYTALSHM